MNATRCLTPSYWLGLCWSNDDATSVSSLDRLQAKIVAQKMKLEDMRGELASVERLAREHVRCKDMTSAKSAIRRKRSVAAMIAKAEHQLSCTEAILLNLDEIAEVRDTAEIVVQLQREFRGVNVDRLYQQVARASDALSVQKELVTETNQLLASANGESSFAVDDAALEAELAEMCNGVSEEAPSVGAAGAQFTAPAAQVVHVPPSPMEAAYSRFMSGPVGGAALPQTP